MKNNPIEKGAPSKPTSTVLNAHPTLSRPWYANLLDSTVRTMLAVFKIGAYPGFCALCGHPTIFAITDENLRENVICIFCKSSNRARQMYQMFSLQKKPDEIRIWNMENSGSLHTTLQKTYGEKHVYSAYIGENIASGTIQQDVRHEDVRKTSFPSDCFDFIFSSEVLEHVPNPEDAFKELYRILKPNGTCIFTVPFLEDQKQSDIRAIEDNSGELVLLKEPQYHADPLRPKGILVFTLFGWDLLDMAREAGLACTAHKLYKASHGIIGPGTVVFTAVKPMHSLK